MVLSLPTSGSWTATGNLQCKSNSSYGLMCLLLGPEMRLTQEWLNRQRDFNLHFRASSCPRLTLWLVGWFPVILLVPTTYKEGTDKVFRNVGSHEITQKKEYYNSVSWWWRFHHFSLESKSSAAYLDKVKSRTRSIGPLCVNKWGSDVEQIALNVESQSTFSLSSCPWSLSESELSLLKVVIFTGDLGTSNSPLWWTGLIADDKSWYFTVCLDLEMIAVIFVTQKWQSDEWSFGSLQSMGSANSIWRQTFTHPARSLTHVSQKTWCQLLSWPPTLHPK